MPASTTITHGEKEDPQPAAAPNGAVYLKASEAPSSCVAPQSLNTLVLPSIFIIDLYINPDAPQAQDDVYTLLNEDGSVHQRRKVADDAIRGDGKLTLVFTGLSRGTKYSLEIDEGSEGKYFALYQVLLEDLIELDKDPDSVQDGAGNQPLPQDYSSLAAEEDLPEIPEEYLLTKNSGRDTSEAASYVPPSADRLPTEAADEFII
ncbi:MAG: hypothetical protein ACRD68_01780 [Pyrinomonadaceae bacterium]